MIPDLFVVVLVCLGILALFVFYMLAMLGYFDKNTTYIDEAFFEDMRRRRKLYRDAARIQAEAKLLPLPPLNVPPLPPPLVQGPSVWDILNAEDDSPRPPTPSPRINTVSRNPMVN